MTEAINARAIGKLADASAQHYPRNPDVSGERCGGCGTDRTMWPCPGCKTVITGRPVPRAWMQGSIGDALAAVMRGDQSVTDAWIEIIEETLGVCDDCAIKIVAQRKPDTRKRKARKGAKS